MSYNITRKSSFIMGSRVLLLTLLISCIEALDIDPCQNHSLLQNNEYRGQECFLYDVGKALCDRRIDSGWYASKYENAYVEMPSSCPAPFSCDTSAPIWLNGTYPNITEGIVDRQLCVRGIYPDECCKTTIPARMKNCGTYNVYELQYTDTCDYAYCFGNHTCPQTEYKQQSANPQSDLSPDDPCLSALSLYNSDLRGTNCSLLEVPKPLCDRMLTAGWYNVKLNGKSQNMPTFCINAGACGTSASIWLNGTLPSHFYETVTRKACITGFLPGECCKKSYTVLVKNCATYNVYYLPYTDSCDEAYCFGDQRCIFREDNKPTDTSFSSEKIIMFTAAGVIICLLISVLLCLRFYVHGRGTRRVNSEKEKQIVDSSGIGKIRAFQTESPPPSYNNLMKRQQQ